MRSYVEVIDKKSEALHHQERGQLFDCNRFQHTIKILVLRLMNTLLKFLSFLLSIAVDSNSVFSEAFRPSRKVLIPSFRCGGLEDVNSSANSSNEGNGDDSQSSPDVSRTMYNKQATNWVRTEPRCLSDFTGRPVVFDMLSEELQSRASKIVLDVGCGEGYCARKAVELGASKVIASDISQGMIDSAIETSEGDSRLRYYVALCGDLLKGLDENRDYLGIERAEEAADVAIAVFLFNYLTTFDMEEAIEQVYKALKPGGVFIFSVPHPSMIFCHDKGAIFHLDSEGKGYYSSRNEKILGQISTIDGTKLNIMSVHKTLGDYMHAINKAGFHVADIKEAGVTDEHMNTNPDFFNSVKDRPLHLVFKLKKP